jgi:hypothetical protein
VKESRHHKKRPFRPCLGDAEVGVKSYYADEVVEGVGGDS